MRSHKGYLSPLLAASYALAITCGALFHDHGATATAPCTGCHGCSHGLQHGSAPGGEESHRTSPGERPTDPCGSGDSHCPVCQFLCEQPFSPAALEGVVSELLAAEIHAAAPLRPAVIFVPLWHGRAPPPVA